MGTQFAHLELWTVRGSQRAGKLRWSAREILSEMSREPGSCDHVLRPETPIQLYGIAPMQLADELEAAARRLKDTRGRSTASRARVLLAAVYSYPEERGQADPRDEVSWAADVLAFNLKFFGSENIRSAVAHTDEKYFHVHVAVTAPVREGRMCWEEVHPGLAAENGVKLADASPKQRRTAYVSAMRYFQDCYYKEVAIKHGQARTGPRRRRLTREEWHTEQRVSSLLQKAAGRPMSDILVAAHWQERYERAEKEKVAALERAAAAEQKAEKLRRQAIRLLTKLRRYVKEKIWRRQMTRRKPALYRERERNRQMGKNIV
ncbi:MAG: hypothetical protein Q7V31_10435 [Parvibaculum sp.]|uniref:hypothetical protein n=1 Tax=Parvibaculum sp. TaxID=2024848 RepID=UPI0027241DE3|nr:hypothetical protein [Parvibaculum sp.]MDO8839335.1 hypothetical protein [Parvibaculum sp.]MDP2149263.1 hypothetical protein [Parvibaculum sp.]